jgi:radical SAM superfamily enzyme YgiQ (UPF0313 family)
MKNKKLSIAFIDTSNTWSNDGSRLIPSILKESGHLVNSINLVKNRGERYKESELEGARFIFEKSDIVMMSVYSLFASRAAEVTNYIHRKYPGLNVIWGGPHCISAPELSLQYADGICYAEGDQTVSQLADNIASGHSYETTPNMAFNINGEIVKNPAIPPNDNLDSLPYPDFDFDSWFYLDKDLGQMDANKLLKYLVNPGMHRTLWVLTSRGCPFLCTYCNNHRYFSIYGKNRIRFRSVNHFIGELRFILERLDFFELIGLADDDFMARPANEIENFAERYRAEIGMPFFIAASAISFREEKYKTLIDAGLRVVDMGVQSGSQRTLKEVYKRPIKLSKTKEAAKQILELGKHDEVQLILDFIIDNPYETRDDLTETYKYISELDPAVNVRLYVLSFFPGTVIYNKALSDGLIEPFSDKTFRSFFFHLTDIKYQRNYETFLILLAQQPRFRRMPLLIRKFLGMSACRVTFSALPGAFYDFLFSIMKKYYIP